MKQLMEVYTVEEVAGVLKIHPYTVRRLSREGKIQAFKFGGQWRYDVGQIESWRKKQTERLKT